MVQRVSESGGQSRRAFAQGSTTEIDYGLLKMAGRILLAPCLPHKTRRLPFGWKSVRWSHLPYWRALEHGSVESGACHARPKKLGMNVHSISDSIGTVAPL